MEGPSITLVADYSYIIISSSGTENHDTTNNNDDIILYVVFINANGSWA